MNIANIHERLYRARLISDQVKIALTLATGKTLGFPGDPHPTPSTDLAGPMESAKIATARDYVETDAAGIYVAQSLNALLSLAETTDTTQRDQRLTDLGRSEKLEPARGTALSLVALAWDALEHRHAPTVAAAEESLFGIPKIAPGDYVTRADDSEIRAWLRSLPDGERSQARDQMLRGEGERVTLAVLRSPIPLGIDEQLAVQGLRNAISRTNPQAVAHVEQLQASLEWARSVIREAARQIMMLTRWDPSRVYAYTFKTDGTGCFGFTPSEVEQYERRRQAELAAQIPASAA